MGNIQILYVNDALKQYFIDASVRIGDINIMDFFPTFLDGYTNKNTLENLKYLVLQDKQITINCEDVVEVFPSNKILSLIKEEEILSSQIRDVICCDNKCNRNIYRFVYVIRRLSISQNKPMRDIMIKILDHPTVNPLTIAIIYGDDKRVTKYLYQKDDRINLLDSYLLINKFKPHRTIFLMKIDETYHYGYKFDLRHRIVQKLALINFVIKSISNDVYSYYRILLPVLFNF